MQTRTGTGWSGRRAKWREQFWTAFGLFFFLAAQSCLLARCQAADEDVLAALQVTWRATFDGWLGGNHCNTGIGIVCDESGNIIEISITGYSMGGPLSTAIGSLTSLTKLLIENCCLKGPLPSTLGLLTNLQSLSVKSNCLDGSVPDALGNLVSLQELRLGSNPFLGGTFPTSFVKLSQLTTLDYSGSLFYCPNDGVYCTAKKPGYSASAFCRACLGFCVTCKTSASATLSTQEDALADLQYRWQLLIPGWYSGSDCIAGTGITCDGAGKVTSISLPCSYNFGTMRGSLATSIAILKSLTKLELISCTLTGSIPSNIGDLTNLQWINLSGNQFSGSIPSSIGNLISLQYLNLYDNIWMGGTLPASLIGLTRLTYLTFTPLMNCPPNGIACPGKKAGYSALPFCSQYCSSFCLTCVAPPPTPSPPPPKPSPPPPKASPPPPKPSPPPPKPSPPPPRRPSPPPPSPPSPPPPPPSPPPPKPAASPRPPPPKPKPPPPVKPKPPPPKLKPPPPKLKPPPPKPSSPPPKPKPPPPRPKPPPRRPPPPPPAPPPPLPARTYGFSAASTFAPRYLNRNVFRHASVGYDYTRRNWILHSSSDWTTDNNRIGLAMPLPVKNQGACAACWAIAAVTSVDAAAALAYGTLADIGSVPDLSFQQVISCNGNYGCSGGLPSAALDYVADYARTGPNWPAQSRGLYLQSSIPYSATNASCKFTTCLTCKPTQYGITMFEQADFLTWFGLLLTLQQQPAVVSLYAACTSFLAYSSGVFEDTSCDGVPNHSVLAVGYRLDAGKPYWILQNSWGTKWGNAGRMQMAIVGGYGLCNVHLTPALYPVITTQNPCDGDMNPCGDGVCTPNGPGGNLCQCNDPFVAVTNIDGKTQSCVPKAVCSFYFYNPCSVGTCVDDGLGGYSCVCPPGFVHGVHATDNSSTCVPGMGLPVSYQVSFGGLTCDVLAATFGLTGDDLRSQNPELPDCSKPLPLGTVVNVTPPQSLDLCSVVYTWNEGDTCSDVADLFNMAESFADLERLNPWLQCTADPPALPGMQICVRRGQDPVSLANCTAYYTAQKGETCATIRDKFNLDVFSFYSLNPGIYCGRIQLSSDVLSGQQVCVSTSTSEYRQCPTGSTPRTVVPGDSCLNLAARFFGSLKRMADYNYGFQCSPLQLFAGRAICIPPATTRQPPPISKQSARLLLSAREL